MVEFEKEITAVKRTIQPRVNQARAAIAKVEREKEAERKRLEQIRLQEVARQKTNKANEIGMYVEYLCKQVKADDEKENYAKVQQTLVGLLNILESDARDRDCQSAQVRAVIAKHMQRIKKGLQVIFGFEKDLSSKDEGELENFEVVLSEELAKTGNLRGETKGSKILGKIGIKWDSRDGPKGHQPTASRCDLYLQRRLK